MIDQGDVTGVHEDLVVDFATAAHAALVDLRDRIGLDSWLVARRDGDDYVVLAAVDDVFGGRAGAIHRWEDTFCARMVDGSAPMVAPDVDLVPAYVRARGTTGIHAKSYLTVPIKGPDGSFLGTLCAAGKDVRTAELTALLPTVKVQAAMLGMLLTHELHAVESTRLLERTAAASDDIDVLTGVASRRSWDAALAAEESRARDHAGSVAVVVLDVGKLRDVNERCGHGAGDDVLVRTGAILRANVRGADLVARLGGSEFGVLLPLTDVVGARALVDHLRDQLAESGVATSVGVGVRHSDMGLALAWQDADAAMHADKRSVAARRRRTPDRPVGVREGGPRLADQPVSEPWSDAATVPAVAPGGAASDDSIWKSQPDDRSSRGTGSVDALLRLARDQLGMDVAFLTVFEGSNRRIRNAQSIIDLPVAAGFVGPSERTHCLLIAEGRVPEVMSDARLSPVFTAIPATEVLGIRAFVGVPIHRRNGELYGTLCVFSQRPDDSLRARDADVLRSLGEIAMDLVEVDDRHEKIRHDLITRLDRVYADGGPQSVFQRVVSLDELRVVGFEALSRFPGSNRTPAEWFSGAAAAGFGTELELRALANAVGAIPRIDGFLAVNVSPSTVRTPAFARQISRLPLDRLVIELTEHERIYDYDTVIASLRPLREQGLRIAVDDAGAGFASMAHILALLPDLIKLDISLVRGIDGDGARQALAAAMAAFAVKTGAAVVAEGVETEAELNCLRDLGVAFGQGYHLGRPGPLPLRQRENPAPAFVSSRSAM